MMRHQILHGDCIERLRELPAESVQCCVTSPPYYALRSYLKKDDPLKCKELGSESTVERYIENQVAVFREVRRVLRSTGVVWLNIGDSYANSGGCGFMGGKQGTNVGSFGKVGRKDPAKYGQLLMVPHLLALALRADGWIVRNDVVWAKKSPMPESINGWRWQKCRVKIGKANRISDRYGTCETNGVESDLGSRGGAVWIDCPGCPRCLPNSGYVLRRGSWRHTRSHEFIFQLVKYAQYFCDAQAVAEKAAYSHWKPGSKKRGEFNGKHDADGSATAGAFRAITQTRNPRSVLHLSSEPNKTKHYAAFPTELIRPLLLSSTSAKGHCIQCGAPMVRIIQKVREATRPATNNKRSGVGAEAGNCDPERHVSRTETLGWRASCDCQAAFESATILDPYAGTGTTLVVAKSLGLSAIGIDLSADYCEIARRRLKEHMPLFTDAP